MEIKRFVKELWAFMRVRKKLWLLPIVVVLGGIAILFLLIQGSSAAPSIYNIF
jgi:hypothetical protein